MRLCEIPGCCQLDLFNFSSRAKLAGFLADCKTFYLVVNVRLCESWIFTSLITTLSRKPLAISVAGAAGALFSVHYPVLILRVHISQLGYKILD